MKRNNKEKAINMKSLKKIIGKYSTKNIKKYRQKILNKTNLMFKTGI
jgi:hypothetical protein